MKKNKLFFGYVMVILSAVIFGLMPLMTKVIRGDGANSMTIVLLRNLLSLPVLAILAFAQSKTLKIPVKALPSMACAALMGCCLTPIFLYSSYEYLSANDSVATVFHFVYPAVVVLGGWVFLKEKINKGVLLSLLLCIVGICLFYDPSKPLNMTGAVLALISGVTYAIYVLFLSVFMYKQVNGFLFSFYISVICSVVLIVACLVIGVLVPKETMIGNLFALQLPRSIVGWSMSLFFALVLNVGAVVLFQKGTFLIGGQRASILSTMEPVTSIVVSVISGVIIGVGSWIGSALVIASAIMIAVFDSKKK